MAAVSGKVRLQVERLESRRVPAVRVFVSDGDLFVTGNGEDDEVIITQIGFQQYEVVATDIVNDDDEVRVVRVRDDFKISLGAGFDTIILDGDDSVNGRLTVPDELFINTGLDDDFVGLFSVRVPDNVTINTNSGFDTVQIFDSVFGDDSDVVISTGADDDFVDIFDSFFGDEVDIYLGRGFDTLTACDNVFTDETSFFGGADEDQLFHTNLYLDDLDRFGFELDEPCD